MTEKTLKTLQTFEEELKPLADMSKDFGQAGRVSSYLQTSLNLAMKHELNFGRQLSLGEIAKGIHSFSCFLVVCLEENFAKGNELSEQITELLMALFEDAMSKETLDLARKKTEVTGSVTKIEEVGNA